MKILKKFNQRNLYVFFIILSFIIIFLFIQNKEIHLDKYTENNQTYFVLNTQSLFNPNNIWDNIDRAFGAPFDLNFFEFCIKDSTTFKNNNIISILNGSIFYSVMARNITENLSTLKTNSEICSDIYVDSYEKFYLLPGSGIYTGSIKIINQEKIKSPISNNFTINYETYAKQVPEMFFVKKLFLFFVILALIDLFFNIFKKLMEKNKNNLLTNSPTIQIIDL